MKPLSREGWQESYRAVLTEMEEQVTGLAKVDLEELARGVMEKLYGPCPKPEPPSFRVMLAPEAKTPGGQPPQAYIYALAGSPGVSPTVDVRITLNYERFSLDSAREVSDAMVSCVAWCEEYGS